MGWFKNATKWVGKQFVNAQKRVMKGGAKVLGIVAGEKGAAVANKLSDKLGTIAKEVKNKAELSREYGSNISSYLSKNARIPSPFSNYNSIGEVINNIGSLTPIKSNLNYSTITGIRNNEKAVR